jgi:hypothetical protein
MSKLKSLPGTLYVSYSKPRGYFQTVRIALHPVPTHFTKRGAYKQLYPFRIIWINRLIKSDLPLDFEDGWVPSCLGAGYRESTTDLDTNYETSFEEAIAWLQGENWPPERNW